MRSKVLVGVFESEEAVLEAVRAVREAGHLIQDVYTPFPVHGMDDAMGLPSSVLPKYCFAFGVTGLTLTLLFQYWVSVFNWPMNIGGKPFAASPALIPVAFEVTVLFAGLGSVATLFALRGMRPGRRPEVPVLGGTDDRFLVAVHEGGQGAAVRALLGRAGALSVDEGGRSE